MSLCTTILQFTFSDRSKSVLGYDVMRNYPQVFNFKVPVKQEVGDAYG